MADFVGHGYKWVHPACGHEVPLTTDQRMDLAVPDNMLEMLKLPKPGMPADPFQSYCHPANRKYLQDLNPDAELPPLPNNFTQTSATTWSYGGWEIKQNPLDLPMGVTHPQMNMDKNLDPGNAIMNGLKSFGNERSPDSSLNLGWPGAHVDCPRCTREKAEKDFERLNKEMTGAGERGEDWQAKSRQLGEQLMKLTRVRRPMPINAVMPPTLNPTPHPEDPPIVRGPRPSHIMRNAQNQGASMQDGYGGGGNQIMSPDGRFGCDNGMGSGPPGLPAAPPFTPPRSGQSSAYGIRSPPNNDFQSPPHQDGFGGPMNPRSRSGTNASSNYGQRSRSGTASGNRYDPRSRGNTFGAAGPDFRQGTRTRGNTGDMAASNPYQAIQNALAKVNLNSQPTSQMTSQGNTHNAQGFQNNRMPSRPPSSAANNGGSMQGPFSPPRFSGAGQGPPAFGSFPPQAPVTKTPAQNNGRGNNENDNNNNRAIPIVHPETGKPSSASSKNTADQAKGSNQPRNGGNRQRSGSNFASKNAFGVLHEDDDASETTETAGGVRI